MKNSFKIIAVVFTAVMALCMTGCVSISESYSNSDKYSAGNCEFNGVNVKSLDINWSIGKVKVTRNDKETVTVTESCGSDLKDSEKVHTWLDEGVLRIHYCKSGETYFLKRPQKDLEITVPAEMKLKDISMNGSSCDTFIENIEAESISVDLSSGDSELVGCIAKTIDVEASSGDIIIGQKGKAESVSAEASSGDVTIEAENAAEISADTSSGEIEVTVSEAKSVNAESSSGEIELHFAKMPSEVDAESSSGEITVYVPENAGFTADIDTSSGDFDSDLSLSKDGSTYVSGDGSSKLNLETSSGDIRIRK